MHCNLCIAFFALYSVDCSLCITLYALYSINCILFIIFYVLYYMHCILCIVIYALYHLHCMLCIQCYAMHSKCPKAISFFSFGNVYAKKTKPQFFRNTKLDHLALADNSHLSGLTSYYSKLIIIENYLI